MKKKLQKTKAVSKIRRATAEDINLLLSSQVAEVIGREHLETDLRAGAPLRVKLGADPSAPDLHLGHAVVLRKLRQFQQLGHTAVFIIGDYTARIGDPSGKSKTRPQLDPAAIAQNAKTYFDQVGKIVDLKAAEIHYNSEWFAKMPLSEVIGLLARFTVARVIERDDFAKRLKAGADIGLHELLYPAMQAYDSAAINASVELGGTDQKFNMLAGRELQKKMGFTPQDVLICPLLRGTDGVQKMSKSLGNYIGLSEAPDEMYGKTMSIPDTLIVHYFELAAAALPEEIAALRAEIANGINPRDFKMRLARRIVSFYWGEREAIKAEESFSRVFQKHETPSDIKQFEVKEKKISLIDALVSTRLVASKTEARRVIGEGAVKVNGAVNKNLNAVLELPKDGLLLQKGKRGFVRLVIK